MIPWAPIVGAGIATAGLLGGGGGSGSNDDFDAAFREYSRIKQPTAEEMRVQLQKYVQAGILTPEQAQTYLANGTSFDDINVDPSTRAAQADALRQLSDISNEGGMTAIDRSKVMAINDEIGTANRGAQEAITQNMAERGTLNSGAELAARLSGQQTASTIGSRNAADVAAAAQERALQAIASKANLGGSMRSADFEQEARKAAARDAITQFNTTNKQTVANANVDRTNRAAEINLTNKQGVVNQNTTAENANRVRNADLNQQVFDNATKIAAGKSGIYSAEATAEEERRKRDEAFRNTLIGAGGTLLASGGK